MSSPDVVMAVSYNYGLVTLSILIAMAASYAALDLAGRVTAARGGVRLLWLGGGAAAMGTGIWSMHYVGMLAFRLPVPVAYDWPTALVSLAAAVAASAMALFVVSREKMGLPQAIAGSIFMGGGIAGMRYIGMSAMRMPGMCHYSRSIVTVSVVLAVVISFAALSQAFRFRREMTSGGWRKALTAVLMGAAILVTHYTGMAAATFTAGPGDYNNLSHALSISSLGTAGIVVVTFTVLGFAFLSALLDRRFAAEIERSNEFVTLLLESAPEAIYGADTKGKFTFCNRAFLRLLGYDSPTEILGKEGHYLIHHTKADGRPYPMEECQVFDAFRTGKETHIDDELLWRKDGTSFPAEYWSRPIHHQGRTIGAVVTFVDITERKKVEAALRESEQRFRAIFEGVPTGIAVVEVATGKVAANRTYRQMLGCGDEEIQHLSTIERLTHPEDREPDRLWFQGCSMESALT